MFGCSYNLIKTAKELIKANNMCNHLRESGCVFASTCLFVSLSVGRMLKRLRMNFREIYIRGRSSARNNHLAVGGDLEPPCENITLDQRLLGLYGTASTNKPNSTGINVFCYSQRAP